MTVAWRTSLVENLARLIVDDRETSRPSLADAIDLLDLVRGAEDSARVSMEVAPAAVAEEFVDVGDDAVDAPPSIPPSVGPRVIASPAVPVAPARKTTLHAVHRVPSIEAEAKTPVLPFAVFFAVAAVGAYLFLTLSPATSSAPAPSGPKAADLQLQRDAE